MSKTPRTASATRFYEQITGIAGIDKFALVRNDGRIVTHNMLAPDGFVKMVTACGLSSVSLRKPLGVSHLKQIILNRPNNQSVIIFPLYKYFLGIQKLGDTDQDTIIHNVSQLLRQITQKQAH